MNKRSILVKKLPKFMTKKRTVRWRRQKFGFTVIELLVVMSLLSILSVGGVWAYKDQIAKARDARRKADLIKISQALSSYFDDHQIYPDTSLTATCDNATMVPYLQTVPCDPINSGIYRYQYEPNLARNYYSITANLEKDSLGVYQITSDGGAGGANTEEGVPPTCGSGIKYCYPNVCSSCCPGTNYRCSASGRRCVIDVSCKE